MNDFEIKIENQIMKLIDKQQKHQEEIAELRSIINSSIEVRFVKLESLVNNIKEDITKSFNRMEITIEKLNTSQNDTTKVMTGVVTKVGIFSAIFMTVVAAVLAVVIK